MRKRPTKQRDKQGRGATPSGTTGSAKAAESGERKVDRYFSEFASMSQHPGHRALQYLFIPLFSFGLLGLIWMIPFPEIAFLKKHGYHIFLNWGSFFIAVVVYYYLRLAPTLSYAVLVTIGVMSYFIVQLEYVEAAGGPAVWMVCGLLMILPFLILWLGSRAESRPVPFREFLKMLVHGPIWLWHFVFRKLRIPY